MKAPAMYNIPDYGIAPETKAKELLNVYDEKKAVRITLLYSIAEKIEVLNQYYVVDGPWDEASTTSSIKELKYWKDVLIALDEIKVS